MAQARRDGDGPRADGRVISPSGRHSRDCPDDDRTISAMVRDSGFALSAPTNDMRKDAVARPILNKVRQRSQVLDPRRAPGRRDLTELDSLWRTGCRERARGTNAAMPAKLAGATIIARPSPSTNDVWARAQLVAVGTKLVGDRECGRWRRLCLVGERCREVLEYGRDAGPVTTGECASADDDAEGSANLLGGVVDGRGDSLFVLWQRGGDRRVAGVVASANPPPGASAR